MAILAHALTTVARVKSRMEIPVATTTWDALIAELINGATDFIEGECGGRRFKSATHTTELHSLERDERFIYLHNYPVTSISAIQYRAGTPATPSWTTFQTDDYEILEDGQFGVLVIHAAVHGFNVIRVTYVGGYTIDFSTASGHLPYELSDLCERLASWAFKKRDAEGKSSEGAQEASVSWFRGLSDDDKRILSRYSRLGIL